MTGKYGRLQYPAWYNRQNSYVYLSINFILDSSRMQLILHRRVEYIDM